MRLRPFNFHWIDQQGKIFPKNLMLYDGVNYISVENENENFLLKTNDARHNYYCVNSESVYSHMYANVHVWYVRFQKSKCEKIKILPFP